jgi:hypothetical protein
LILIVHMDNAETLSTQAWVTPAQRDQLARETQVIDHLFVARVEACPIEQQVIGKRNNLSELSRFTNHLLPVTVTAPPA